MKILLTGGGVDLASRRGATRRCIDLLDGYLRNTDGRFILYVAAAFPGAHANGKALRSRVVWWLHTGEVIKGAGPLDVHHKNHDRGDDRFSNLARLGHVEHSQHHNPKGLLDVEVRCRGCNTPIYLPPHKIRAGRGRYCSQACYHATPYSQETKDRMAQGLQRAYAEGRR